MTPKASVDLDKMRLALMDGCALRNPEGIFLCAAFADVDVNISRMLLWREGQGWRDFDAAMRAVAVGSGWRAGQEEYAALGRDGLVILATDEGMTSVRIPDAGVETNKIGFVVNIRTVQGQWYVCGDRHQAYRFDGQRWRHIDEDVLVHDVRTVGYAWNDLHEAGGNLYFVGERGRIYRFDGGAWRREQSPTNVALQAITRFGDDLYIAGGGGTLLGGQGGEWEVVDVEEADGETLWDITGFDERLYMCTAGKLISWDRTAFEVVELPAELDGSLHSLSASDESLWVVGVNNVFRYTSSGWEERYFPGRDRG